MPAVISRSSYCQIETFIPRRSRDQLGKSLGAVRPFSGKISPGPPMRTVVPILVDRTFCRFSSHRPKGGFFCRMHLGGARPAVSSREDSNGGTLEWEQGNPTMSKSCPRLVGGKRKKLPTASFWNGS